MRTCKRCGGKTVAGLDPKKDEHFNPYVCITNLDNRIKDLAADARSLADEVEKLRAEISERDASSAQLDAGGGVATGHRATRRPRRTAVSVAGR